jgi:hypothetical protein
MNKEIENLFYHTKPHKRFVIYGSSEPTHIKNIYKRFVEKNLLHKIDIVVQDKLNVQHGDLVWIDTFMLKTEEIIEEIEKFTSNNFFEIITNEELETYMFTRDLDSKDLILEGTILRHKGETRHFMIKNIGDYYIYSPLKLWSQNIEVQNITDKLTQEVLHDFSDMSNYRKSKPHKYLKLLTQFESQNNFLSSRSWIVWGVPLMFEIENSNNKFYVEQENIIYDCTQITTKLEDFSQFLNSDFFEIDLKTGETSFYNPENLPQWVNKFLMNSWRHGYFKYYYPELCV